MKRIIVYAFLVLGLISCGHNGTGLLTIEKNDNSTSLEQFLEDYHKDHPNWLINEIVAKKTNDSLMAIFESVADTIFNDYPLKAISVNEYEKGCFCVGLQAWQKPSGFELNNNINIIGGDIIALVSKEQALQVKIDEFYCLKGKFVKRTNHDFYQSMTKQIMPYTDGYGVKKDETWKEKYDFGFGILVYVVDTLIVY